MFGSDAMMIRRSRESGPPDNEVWYYAPSQVTLYDSTDVQSHTFANGKGVLKFASAVHSIGQWLRGTAVTDVKMPETVTNIGLYAFYGCSSLALTSLPSGLTSIEPYAFHNCTSLALTSLPSGLTSIDSYAFYRCSSLALTSLPSGLSRIGGSAFYGCSSLALTSLPSGLTRIDSYAFYGCSSLALTSLPSGLTSIGARAFENCSSLALTSLPNGLNGVGYRAFYGCSSLALTSLPSGLTSIDSYAFYGCSSLALTSLPSGLTSIGERTFSGCTSFALTELPSGLTSIGAYAFSSCWKSIARSLTFEGTPTSITNTSFTNNPKLTDIYVPWAEGEVANAPWGATNATIHYAPAPAQYYYTASGSNEAGVNGNYELQSGTHGTTSAVYTNGTYYIYYYSDYWIINTQTGVYGAFYRSGTIEGAYQQMTSFNTPPTVTAYA